MARKQTNQTNQKNQKGWKYYGKAFLISAALALPMLFKSLGDSDMTETEKDAQILSEMIDYDALRGEDGADGQNGRDGIDGQNGRDGVDGTNGQDGIDGKDGVDGADGRDGVDGQNGVDGKDGVDGADGRDGVDGQDGFSTTFDVKEVEGGYQITFTDVNHSETITLMNGKVETQYVEVEHKYASEVTKEATCTASGVRTYSCNECGDAYNEAIDPIGHSYHATNSVVNEDMTVTVTYTCGNCGDSYDETVGNPVHRHVALDAVRENVVEATCTTADSYDAVVYCECGEELSRETIIGSELGHDYIVDETTAIAPQPGVAGKEADEVCSRCGDVIEGAAIDALHVHVELDAVRENEVAATCCENGSYDEVVYCECGEELNRETFTIDALGHDYVVDETTAVEPQVGVAGKEADSVCTRCGDTVEGATIEALVDYSFTRCEFNEFGWGFYINLEGEEICTTRGAYRDYLAANYPNATICEDEFAIWCE